MSFGERPRPIRSGRRPSLSFGDATLDKRKEEKVAFNWVNDLGAPLSVTAIDLVVESVAPEWDEWAAYGVCGLSWLANLTGFARGDFVKNIAISSTPLAARKIYDRVRGMASPVRSRLAMKKVSRYPAPLVEEPFGGARLV